MNVAMNKREAIQNGIELLTLHKPGWQHLINLDSLRMESHTHCVLGQLYGRFGVGLNSLFPNSEHIYLESRHNGFSGLSFGDEAQLTPLWKEEILKLRHAA